MIDIVTERAEVYAAIRACLESIREATGRDLHATRDIGLAVKRLEALDGLSVSGAQQPVPKCPATENPTQEIRGTWEPPPDETDGENVKRTGRRGK